MIMFAPYGMDAKANIHTQFGSKSFLIKIINYLDVNKVTLVPDGDVK